MFPLTTTQRPSRDSPDRKRLQVNPVHTPSGPEVGHVGDGLHAPIVAEEGRLPFVEATHFDHVSVRRLEDAGPEEVEFVVRIYQHNISVFNQARHAVSDHLVSLRIRVVLCSDQQDL